jgi:hypothetical protein
MGAPSFFFPTLIFLLCFVCCTWSQASWYQANLSQPRYYLAATTIGNLALFAGGSNKINAVSS